MEDPLIVDIYPSNFIRFSVAGIPQSDQFTIHLNGDAIEWVIEKGVGKDRYFYKDFEVEEGGFSNEEHEIQL